MNIHGGFMRYHQEITRLEFWDSNLEYPNIIYEQNWNEIILGEEQDFHTEGLTLHILNTSNLERRSAFLILRTLEKICMKIPKILWLAILLEFQIWSRIH